MRSSALALCVLFLPWTSAFKTTLRRVDTGRSAAGPRALYPVINAATADDDVDLVNSMNVVYMADISIGGVDYTVQLDSGSSDLWVRPKGTGTLTGATDTQLTYNITYSIGYAAGNIVTVPVEFAGYTVTSQAVLQVTSSNNPVFSFGADGILGLGFTSLSSVDRVVTAAGGDYGHDFLYNVFARNTSAPNFIAFQLERKNNLASDTDSIFAIGEIEDKYKGISQTQKISTWPVSSPKRWTVLLDGYEYADGIKRTLATKVDGAPSSVVLLDTGASYAYASEDLVTGLYGSVQGASFDSTMGMWVVPCNQEVNFALWIGGRKFDWDPLDVVVPSINDNTTCVGSIIPASLSGFDFHAGDTFLRSLYTVFDFGDFDSSGKMGDPYVRLWSLIDQPTASAEFHQIRGGTAQAYKSSSNADPNAASTTPDVPTNASSDNATSTDDEMAHNIKTLVSYAPIALGVLGLNALLLVVILALGLSFICKRKKKRIANRTSPAAGLSINSTLSRSHSYRQVKSEDVDTPMAQLNFADDPETPHSTKKSHTSSYYAKGEALDSPVDGGDESPSAIRMSRISGHTHTPSKASFKPVPSSLSQTALPLSPSKNSTFADAQANAIPLPTSATSLVFPGDRAASPAAGSVGRAPSPLALSASKGATDLADVSLIDESDPQHPTTPSIEVAPPSQQPSSRANEYLAAMEARRAALAGAGDARRNTYHDEQEEPLEPPRRFGPGGDGRRAMSGYYNNGAPTNLEPLQVPSRRPPPPPVDSPQEETSPHRDNNPSPPPSAGLAYSQEISMPPGPSRSQEYLAAMEARKGAMTESQESWQRNSLGPLQPPPRRLNSGDGRRATYNAQPSPGEGDRGTIYFDAPDTPVDGLSSPMHPRSGPYSQASPQAPLAHGRTGSTSSVSRGSPLKSSMKSPVRSTFNPSGQPPPPVPRSSSNLNPSSGLLPPRRPTDPQHARAGSYAGSSSVPRMTSNMAPPVRSAGWNPRAMPGEEEDLAEQRMDMSFEERVGMQADAFGDGQAPPRRPFAPTSAPGYRYSSAQ